MASHKFELNILSVAYPTFLHSHDWF